MVEDTVVAEVKDLTGPSSENRKPLQTIVRERVRGDGGRKREINGEEWGEKKGGEERKTSERGARNKASVE